MWTGTLATIPGGWALCDGGTYTAPNGDSVTTPNLLDRFVYGVSASKDPGATGGDSSYTLTTAQLPSHSHAISADGTHNHDIRRSWDSGTNYATISIVGAASLHFGSGFISDSGSHSHGGATGSTGSGDSIDNRPSFYKLAFIMKL